MPAATTDRMSYVLTCPNCGPREVTDFSFGGEVNPRPRDGALAARARRLQLLPRQRRGRAARVVVPPLRLRRVVPRRARHAHQRGAAARSCRSVPVTRLPPSATASGSTAAREVSFTFDGKRVAALEGDTIASALFAARPAHLLAQLQVPPPRAGCCAAPASAPTASCRSTARPACAPAPSRCARAWRSST